MSERGYITDSGMTVLRFLSEKMEATSRSVGESVLPTKPGEMPYREIATVGASIAGHLRRQGLVTFLPDMRCWRITKAGREVLGLPTPSPGGAG